MANTSLLNIMIYFYNVTEFEGPNPIENTDEFIIYRGRSIFQINHLGRL